EHPDVQIIFSQVEVFRNSFVPEMFLKTVPGRFPKNIMDPAYTAEDQFRLLLLSDRISFTPSYFFNKNAVLAVGGYDEAFRMVEDYPMWLKLTRAGTKLHFMDKTTVRYRQHERALNNRAKPFLINPSYLNSSGVRKKYVYQHLPW